MKKVIYGFSGDPITFGHIDIIQRAVKVFGQLVVGIGMNPAKKYFFDLEERRQIAADALRFLPEVEVIAFRGLLVDYAYEHNISTIIRGIRNSEDLNYEMMLHQVGDSQANEIDTIYFPAKQSLTHVSSGAAKALQLEQGLIHEFVPLSTKQRLEEKLSRQHILSITGEIGVGKSYVSQLFEQIGKEKGLEVHTVVIDNIGHQILGELTAPLYQKIRNEIATTFGAEIQRPDGFIDRQALGKILFQAPEKLRVFNQMLYKPLVLRLRREIYGKRGLILLDTALIAESNMSYLSNNNVVLVQANEDIQRKRLEARGYTKAQMKNRLNSQFTHGLKKELLTQQIEKDYHGQLWEVDNSIEGDTTQLRNKILDILQEIGIYPKS